MSGFEVDPIELFAAGARVSEAAVDGRASLSRAGLEADEMFAGGWTGAAASAFHGGFDDWLDGTRTMLAGLDDLSCALTAAGHDYDRAERANDTSLDGIAINRLAS